MKVGIDSIADAIKKIEKQYGEEVSDRLKSDLQYAGEMCASDVVKGAPKSSGTYAGDWDYRFKAKGDQLVVKVGNSGKHATLSHLLEKGHMSRGGTWVGGKKHIEPAYERAVEYLDRRLHG